MKKTMVTWVDSLQPTEDHIEVDIHTASQARPHAALKEAAACGKSMLEQDF